MEQRSRGGAVVAYLVMKYIVRPVLAMARLLGKGCLLAGAALIR